MSQQTVFSFLVLVFLAVQCLVDGAFVQNRQSAAAAPSCNVINDMKDAINRVLGQSKEFETQATFIGFNGCVGGCDGCIDYGVEENQEMLAFVDALEEEYTSFAQAVSRADFWALAYKIGLERATEADICFDLTWGRTDKCMGGPGATVPTAFPQRCNGSEWFLDDTSKDGPGIVEYFKTNFAFSVLDTTVILGLYPFDSSLNTPGVLGLKYYQTLFSNKYDWVQEVGYDGDDDGLFHKCKWIGSGEGGEKVVMFNSDIELAYNTELSSDANNNCFLDTDCIRKQSCGKDGVCDLQRNFDSMYFARTFSQNSYLYYEQLKVTLEVLLSTGADQELTTLGGTCATTCE